MGFESLYDFRNTPVGLAVLIFLAILDLSLVYAVFRISKGRRNNITKVVRDQDEEAAANARDDTITLPSSVVHCKETETEKFVTVTQDMQWVFILIPVVCLCMTFECIVLSMGVTVGEPLSLAEVFLLTDYAAISPLLLWIVFDLAYCVHKWRSVQFCGIKFDQGRRINADHCSWVMRYCMRCISLCLFVLGVVLFIVSVTVGEEHEKGSDFSSLWIWLTTTPTLIMLTISVYLSWNMLRYGQQASMVVQQKCACRFWVTLLLGNICYLAGMMWWTSTVEVLAQSIFVICIILTLKEVLREADETKNFEKFLLEDCMEFSSTKPVDKEEAVVVRTTS